MEINPKFSKNAKDDFRIVVRAKEGDQKAYAELMERYKDGIYYLALKMLSNKDDAMDIAVETFGKAFENLDKYRPEFAFSTWLFRIATNNCIDFLRRRKLDVVSINQLGFEEAVDHPMQLPAESPNPEERSISKDESGKLKMIVDNMPERYRKLIILRFYDDLSYEEIALHLDLPMGTIKTQLSKARRLLQNVLNANAKIEG